VSSCLLYHGPGARQTALNRAAEIGILLAPPFGDDGLKTDEAREAVVCLQSPPVEGVGVVVIGPMDEALPKASDVLLKRIEEFDGSRVQPILWAYDLGGVSPTVRSRCLDEWVPSVGTSADNEEITSAGWSLVDAALNEDFFRLPELLRPLLTKEDKTKGKEILLLLAMSDAVSTDLASPERRALWERLRRATCRRNPTLMEVVAALVGG